jgi:ribosomal protein S18 acetylase RimI-like enzyme
VISVRTLSEDDWSEWRALRLQALTEAPGAFGSTVAGWSGAGDREERWRSRLRSVPFNSFAVRNDLPVGMVSGTEPRGDQVELISMWVEPSARGCGVGDALIAAVVAWAREQGVANVVLDVRVSNDRAVALYSRNGFVDVGPAPGEPGDPPERRMRRRLAS